MSSGSKRFVNTYRVTWKKFGRRNRGIELGNWMGIWPGRGNGRYWKQQLSKARRRAWKSEVLYGRYISTAGIERECNWKTW